MKQEPAIHFAYFGSSTFSTYVLDELERAGFIPALIVTTPDKPAGRKLIMTPTPVKLWANARSIPVIAPDKLTPPPAELGITGATPFDLFIVASYGKIIPQAILDIPPHKTLNVHPSLLPQYRGASPVQSAILNDTKDTGVTIMRIDEKMDHGPIVATCKVTIGSQEIPEWPADEKLKEIMGHAGGRLLAATLAPWVAGQIPEVEQDHSVATYTKKISKEDAEINLSDISTKPYETFRKIQAYHGWPSAYFFIKKESGNATANTTSEKTRVKITEAIYNKATDTLTITKVIPEGKAEMSFTQFKAGYKI